MSIENEVILQEMLDIAIGLLRENEICSYCVCQHHPEDNICQCDSLCGDCMYGGLLKEAKLRLNIKKEAA